MSDTKTRRSVALFGECKVDLEKIKSKTGATTDNAAINTAVRMTAKLLDTDMNSNDMMSLISIISQLQPEIKSGCRLILEDPNNPSVKTRIAMPALG